MLATSRYHRSSGGHAKLATFLRTWSFSSGPPPTCAQTVSERLHVAACLENRTSVCFRLVPLPSGLLRSTAEFNRQLEGVLGRSCRHGAVLRLGSASCALLSHDAEIAVTCAWAYLWGQVHICVICEATGERTTFRNT